jgi:hypothetical protein
MSQETAENGRFSSIDVAKFSLRRNLVSGNFAEADL